LLTLAKGVHRRAYGNAWCIHVLSLISKDRPRAHVRGVDRQRGGLM